MSHLFPLSLSHGAFESKEDALIQSLIFDAVRKRRAVVIDYSGKSGKTHRIVEPYRVLHSGSEWYFVGWDRMREAWRTFRINRVNTIDFANEDFELRNIRPMSLMDILDGYFHGARGSIVTLKVTSEAPGIVFLLSQFPGVAEPIDHDSWRISVLADSLDLLLRLLVMGQLEFRVEKSFAFAEHVKSVTSLLQRATMSADKELT